MIRMLVLMRHFNNKDRPQDGSAPSWYKNRIKRGHFKFYIAHEKGFLKDWRDTLREFSWRLGLPQPTGTTQHGLQRAHNQLEMIDDVMDKALKHGYLQEVDTAPYPSDVLLTTDWRGREFSNNPIVFIEALAREYGYFASIVTSFVFGAGGALLIVFWENITDWIAGL